MADNLKRKADDAQEGPAEKRARQEQSACCEDVLNATTTKSRVEALRNCRHETCYLRACKDGHAEELLSDESLKKFTSMNEEKGLALLRAVWESAKSSQDTTRVTKFKQCLFEALHLTIRIGQFEKFKFACEIREDDNAGMSRAKYEETCNRLLYRAIRFHCERRIDTVKLCTEKWEATEKEKSKALLYSIEEDSIELAKAVGLKTWEWDWQNEPTQAKILATIVKHNSCDFLKLLYKAGFPLKELIAGDVEGRLVRRAAFYGRFETLKFILFSGGRIEALFPLSRWVFSPTPKKPDFESSESKYERRMRLYKEFPAQRGECYDYILSNFPIQLFFSREDFINAKWNFIVE